MCPDRRALMRALRPLTLWQVLYVPEQSVLAEADEAMKTLGQSDVDELPDHCSDQVPNALRTQECTLGPVLVITHDRSTAITTRPLEVIYAPN